MPRSPADLTLELHEQYGWPEQAEVVERVYRGLSPQQRRASSILAHDYTQASAINFFGARCGLPTAVSGHMTYYLWSPGDRRGEIAIAYGFARSRLESLFADVAPVATIWHPLASVWQLALPVYFCHGPKRSMKDACADLKRHHFHDPVP